MTKISTKNYNIFVSNNNTNLFTNKIKEIYDGDKLFIITDNNVYNLYKEKLNTIFKNYQLNIVLAENKNFNNYEKTINELLKLNISKNDLLIAFGGGVIGDLTGFIASTLFRGIKYIQIPTTLLSQIDSSVGGKTAIDLDYGKNLVGSFYNPKLVLIDLSFLNTLSLREYNNGLAEAIKMALLFDYELYSKITINKKIDINDIVKIINYKNNIVEIDFYDQKERKLLNFGHTFGHAIEKTNNYQTYKHGEAISYGMLIALKIGEKLNLTNPNIYNNLKKLLLELNLITHEILNIKPYLEIIKFDKKHTNKGLDFIILKDYEKPTIINLKDELYEIDDLSK